MRQDPIFDAAAFLTKAIQGHTVATYQNNQVICAQGASADAIFCITAGKIKITVLSPQGREGVITLLGRGDLFGEECLSSRTHYAASAIAMGECTVVRLDKALALRLIHDNPTFSTRLIAYLLERKLLAEETLVDQLFYSSEKRLARVLVVMANFEQEEKLEATIPKISHETLAEMVGTTRSRISFFMNKFRSQGWVDYNGQLTVNRSLMTTFL